jgi:hypothetical protein
VEASLFSKALPAYLSDDEYRRFQVRLMERPDAGALRVIHYWFKADDQIFLPT